MQARTRARPAEVCVARKLLLKLRQQITMTQEAEIGGERAGGRQAIKRSALNVRRSRR